MEEININDIVSVLKNNDFRGFLAQFQNIDNLASFKEKETGNNIFHLIALHSNAKTAERIYNTYSKINKNVVNSMLLQRNNNNILPASHTVLHKENNSSYSVSLMTEEEQRKKETYNYLKRLTKKNENGKSKQNLYARGEYTFGLSLSYPNNPNGSYVPMYPTVRLVKHEYNSFRGKGLSRKKDDTSFINFEETVAIGRSRKIKKNRSEFVELRNIPITSRPLSEQAREILNFPEDFESMFKTLDTFGYEVRSNLQDPIYSTLQKNFSSRGGVILIENKELQHLKTTFKGKNEYIGLSSFKKIDRNALVPVISLNAKCKNLNYMFSTLNHELSHSSDFDYNTGSVFHKFALNDFMVALVAGRENIPHNLKKVLDNNAILYKASAFGQEALANIVSINHKDELITEYSKLFKNYVEAYKNGDAESLNIISGINEKNIKNGDFLKKLSDSLNKSVIKNSSLEEFYETTDKVFIENKILPSFLAELKDVNKTIDAITKNRKMSNGTTYQDSECHDYLLRKALGIPEEYQVKQTFDKVKSELDNSKSLEDTNKLLEGKLKNYTNSDRNNLALFEVAIVASHIRKTSLDDAISHHCTPRFYSPDDFKKLTLDENLDGSFEAENRKLVKYASKMNRELTTLSSDKPLSQIAVCIAISTKESSKNIQVSINKAVNDISGTDKNEALEVFSRKVKEFSKNTDFSVTDMIEIIKTAELTFKKIHPDKQVPNSLNIKRIHPIMLDGNHGGSFSRHPDLISSFNELLKLKDETYFLPAPKPPPFQVPVEPPQEKPVEKKPLGKIINLINKYKRQR